MVFGYNRPMRVLFVSSGFTAKLGGPPISEASLVAGLAPHCRVRLLCPSHLLEPGFLSPFGIRDVHPYKPRSVFAAWRGKRNDIASWIEESDILHLNCHWRWEYYFFARLAAARGIPFVFHPRGTCWIGHRKVWRKRAFNRLVGLSTVRAAARVILLSEFERSMMKPYRVAEDRIVVLPNGIPSIPPSEAPAGHGQYFLYFGRIERRKNLLFLVEAYAEYRRRGGKAGLWLMGPPELDYDVILERRARTLDVFDGFRIREACYGPEKWNIIRGAVGVVYPAKQEVFGRVPFEAIAAGVHAVLPRESGGAEYLEPLMPECLYRQDDAADLASALQRVEAAQAGKADLGLAGARSWVARELSWDALARRVHSLYQDMVPARGRRKTA